MSYDNTNRFVLFKNNKKETDNHPDYTGSITLPDGTEHYLSAWIKDGKSGKFMSGQIGKAKDTAKSAANPAPSKPAKAADIDSDSDSIPF